MRDAITRFFDAWGFEDAETRASAIAESCVDTVSYADPRAPEPIIGHTALTDYVGMFSANAPGWTAQVVKSDTIAGTTRATVAFGGAGPDGKQMVQHGQYFVEAGDDGRLTRLTGFVGTGTPE